MFLARPRLVLALVAVLALALLYVALRFASFDTAPDTVVDPSTPAFQHEVDYESVFGADPLVVLISGNVETLFNGPGLTSEIAIEGQLAQHGDLGVQSVYGPSSIATVAGATIQNVAAGQLTAVMSAAQTKARADAKAAGKSDADATTIANAAAQAAGKTYIENALKQFPELQKLAPLQASNPKWMDALFINPDTGKPKPRFSAVIPDPNHVVVTARLGTSFRPGAAGLLSDLVHRQISGSPIEKAVTITGVPVLEAAIERGLRLSLFAGMALGVVSMAVLLMVALRRRGRLALRVLPLAAGVFTVFLLAGLVTAIGLGAAAIRSRSGIDQSALQSVLATFSLALNPATLAAFPIALGLAVDYAVQFLYRYTQAVDGAAAEPWDVARRGAGLATRRAAICTVAGLMALLISTIPMVRQFGVVMSLGVVIAWTIARFMVLAAVRVWPRIGMPMEMETEVVEPAPIAVPVAAAPERLVVVANESEDDLDDMLFGLGGVSPEAATEPEPTGEPGPPPIWEPTPWDPGPEAIAELGPRVAYSRAVLEPALIEAEPEVHASLAGSELADVPKAPEPTAPAVIEEAPARTDLPAMIAAIAPAPAGDDDKPPSEPGRVPRILAQFARRHATAILVPALLLAMVGWAALPFSTYESDPQKLVSPNLPALQDLNVVRQATGSAGELDFILSGGDVTSAAALAWTRNLQAVAQRDSKGKLRPLGSLSDLVTAVNGGTEPSADKVQAYLQVMPTYFTDSLLDRSHTLARVAFGINLAPVAEQKQIIDRILGDVTAPPGYTYYPAGFSYLTVRGLESLESGQLVLNVVGAALVLLVLFAIYRRRRLALMAWAPTLHVAGWSTAVLFALRVPLTPMTAVLGALVVAFGTEFAILWLERYREAMADGIEPGAAAAEAASRGAGPGIMVSGAALVLGFLALAVGALPGISGLGIDLPVVRDFGLVAAMDMILAVAAALVVLPAIVVRIGLVEPVRVHFTPEAKVAPADAPA